MPCTGSSSPEEVSWQSKEKASHTEPVDQGKIAGEEGIWAQGVKGPQAGVEGGVQDRVGEKPQDGGQEKARWAMVLREIQGPGNPRYLPPEPQGPNTQHESYRRPAEKAVEESVQGVIQVENQDRQGFNVHYYTGQKEHGQVHLPPEHQAKEECRAKVEWGEGH